MGTLYQQKPFFLNCRHTSGSTFTINGVDAGETCQFPISLTAANTGFCRADISSNALANRSFAIGSVCNSVRSDGSCGTGTVIVGGWVNITWDIASTAGSADVTLGYQQ